MDRQIFISYSRQDMDFVKTLAEDLENEGFDIWYDLTDIDAGDRWAKEIQDGINESEIFVIVVSPNSIKSEWVEKEFLFASQRGLKIVPLLYTFCELPLWLLNIQYVDVVGRNYKKNFQHILDVFNDTGRRNGDREDDRQESVPSKGVPKSQIPWIVGAVIGVAIILAAIFWPKKPAELIEEPTLAATMIPPTETPIPAETETSPTFTATETSTLPTQTSTPLPTEIISTRDAVMVLVPSDVFWMGSDKGEDDEKPSHTVDLKDFYIDKYEVTNAQYLECVNASKCLKPENTTYFFDQNKRFVDHPVVYVGWQDAADFCAWRDARLPTEAEWEKAARGIDRFYYPWGSEWHNKKANATGADDGYSNTSPVMSLEEGKSPYGVFNMAGNVWEWVGGWYDVYPKGDLAASSYFGEVRRIARGGSWNDNKGNILTYKRYDLHPETYNNQIGFRCASDVTE
ncbi:MAG: SUMF1/EgtB/PvdO family nonheme iron enzyme [Anaerolineae bacterium]|jgi:formylglycine-generating enzyme required for sulfatase activity|nr:SUMF1/EgtB/PvdO family nonheme iron enzyme [Anaerolineae bacterium]MBT4310323.1 SUMF1/EgtB/PvdO family nonheme iron enzyme [Anaerolineae bacterium]MBT4681566.1 SUMF1/EgtB/PvdO family nonheme iron enzyme [Chloroflexota bacterium]MBT6060554.1 SUMF1/EgtB/PvdO family nonheme iron enzyme [Anaerolineae bacterium]MBT7484414.1 SUMF1/EgtB/PvdO family nonheme iron enzyme [Candidatus Peregrinibacteria bacterium]